MGNSFERIFRGMDGGGMMVFLSVMIVVVLIVLAIVILFLLTLQRTLERVSPDLRKMSPGLVWLFFIPYFNMIWSFIVVNKFSESVGAEFQRRNIQTFEEKPGFSIGMAWASLNLLAFLLAFADIPFIAFMINISGFICWILFWVKASKLKRELEGSGTWQQQEQAQQAFNYNQQYHQQAQQNYPYPQQQWGMPPSYNPVPPAPQNYMPPPATDALNNYPPPPKDEESRWAPKPVDPPDNAS